MAKRLVILLLPVVFTGCSVGGVKLPMTVGPSDPHVSPIAARHPMAIAKEQAASRCRKGRSSLNGLQATSIRRVKNGVFVPNSFLWNGPGYAALADTSIDANA